MNAPVPTLREQDIMTSETGTVALLARAEVDMQIATAQRFPRSVTAFRRETMEMVTLDQRIAQECIYAIPRDGKVIEGPSARFAEIVASAWGNCRAGARVVNEGPEFITAQGVFHDLQRNVAITFEVQRRITGKNGKRFGSDMIGVTGNAASSIALRQAILKGVPKAFWADMYDAARKMAAGDQKSLVTRRVDAIKAFMVWGVKPAQVFTMLGVQGEDDVSLDHLVILRGVATAIRDGETTPEQAFPPAAAPTPPKPPETAGQAAPPRPPSPPKPPSAPKVVEAEVVEQQQVDEIDWTAELEAYENQLSGVETADTLVEAVKMYGARFEDAPDDIQLEAARMANAQGASIERQS